MCDHYTLQVATIPFRLHGVSFLFPDFPHAIDRKRFRRDGEPTRSTKAVGDQPEAAVLASPVKAGCRISIPFGENHRYDLLCDGDYTVAISTLPAAPWSRRQR